MFEPRFHAGIYTSHFRPHIYLVWASFKVATKTFHVIQQGPLTHIVYWLAFFSKFPRDFISWHFLPDYGLIYIFLSQRRAYCIFLRFWEVTKDATDFINFIETRKVKNQTFLVSMEVTSRLSNIPPDRGMYWNSLQNVWKISAKQLIIYSNTLPARNA